MKVSIVTVCFNSEATIRDSIESVLAQSYQYIEYIIIDGGSTDRTLDVVADYNDRVTTVVSEPDKGIYDAMNKGIILSTGDIVGFLNSDDFYQDDHVIEEVVRQFDINSDTDLVFGDVVFVAPDNMFKCLRHYRCGHFKPWKLRFGWMPAHPATFITKRAYKQVGLYSLDFKISSDFEMFVRLLIIHQLKFSYIGKVLVRMRSGGVSTAGVKSTLLLNQEIVRACKENGVYTNLIFVLTKIPFKLLEFIYKPLESLA